MDCQLAGKRALVTGAASGIGKAIALALAREGATVATHARTAEKCAGTIDEIAAAGGKAFSVAADLTDGSAIAAMCADAIERLGGIDIVVNNAGVCDLGKVEEMEESFWDWVIDTNLKAPFLVTKHTVPTLKQQGTGGALIYNASTNAKTADAEWSAYNTSKHGLIGFVRCIAAELGDHRITSNAICPGWVATPMATSLHETLAEQAGEPFDKVYDESMRFNMLKEILPPEAIADMAVYLASERGKYVTGQSINVCGGLCYF